MKTYINASMSIIDDSPDGRTVVRVDAKFKDPNPGTDTEFDVVGSCYINEGELINPSAEVVWNKVINKVLSMYYRFGGLTCRSVGVLE